jgi:hypothetical protein
MPAFSRNRREGGMNPPETPRFQTAGTQLLGDKGKQGDGPGPLDGKGQGPLVLGAGTGDPPGKYLPPIRDIAPQYHIRIFIIDFKLLNAEFADLLLKIGLPLSAAPLLPVPAIHLGIPPILPGGAILISLIRHILLLWGALRASLLPALL